MDYDYDHDYEYREHRRLNRPKRMKFDLCPYSPSNRPCQLLPTLMGTANVDLYIETASGAQLRIAVKELKAAILRGCYVWAKSNTPVDTQTRSNVGFLVEVANDISHYRPVYTNPGASVAQEVKDRIDLRHISWRRVPCINFYPFTPDHGDRHDSF